jgi:hypothetical protein
MVGSWVAAAAVQIARHRIMTAKGHPVVNLRTSGQFNIATLNIVGGLTDLPGGRG